MKKSDYFKVFFSAEEFRYSESWSEFFDIFKSDLLLSVTLQRPRNIQASVNMNYFMTLKHEFQLIRENGPFSGYPYTVLLPYRERPYREQIIIFREIISSRIGNK